ncbi:hypothetical protein Dip510_000333 [Elusimicrobium posterum]|uniref:hypothetical protein n=1 Tax=Elusimicrobium posterum TaxID=3116653 RepID=UPI003C71CAA7
MKKLLFMFFTLCLATTALLADGVKDFDAKISNITISPQEKYDYAMEQVKIIDPKAKGVFGENYLHVLGNFSHLFTKEQNIALFEAYYEAGVDINGMTERKIRPLHEIASASKNKDYEKYTELVNWLAQKGAEMNPKTDAVMEFSGYGISLKGSVTPLELAIQHSSAYMVKCLVWENNVPIEDRAFALAKSMADGKPENSAQGIILQFLKDVKEERAKQTADLRTAAKERTKKVI